MTKNTSYHYSIIIPHKNTPRLLERCLYSIPTWDEIQIIIIDDNSNSESVDFLISGKRQKKYGSPVH